MVSLFLNDKPNILHIFDTPGDTISLAISPRYLWMFHHFACIFFEDILHSNCYVNYCNIVDIKQNMIGTTNFLPCTILFFPLIFLFLVCSDLLMAITCFTSGNSYFFIEFTDLRKWSKQIRNIFLLMRNRVLSLYFFSSVNSSTFSVISFTVNIKIICMYHI